MRACWHVRCTCMYLAGREERREGTADHLIAAKVCTVLHTAVAKWPLEGGAFSHSARVGRGRRRRARPVAGGGVGWSRRLGSGFLPLLPLLPMRGRPLFGPEWLRLLGIFANPAPRRPRAWTAAMRGLCVLLGSAGYPVGSSAPACRLPSALICT